MKAYRIHRGGQIDGLEQVQETLAAPAAHEVQVRMRAVALNYRDLAVARGQMGATDRAIVPGSDGAGEVIAIGSAVTRFRVGDRVVAAFYPNWIDGPVSTEATAVSFGGLLDGMLAEQVNVPESALVPIPDGISFEAAATVPCAGVTAWHALFAELPLVAGETVLLLGTGGVSMWALQLAKAAGLRVIITSSDDDKLRHALALGADIGINYARIPDWSQEVLRLTDGRGVDKVLEIGGKGTFKSSVASAKIGGAVMMVGGVSGGFGVELDPFALAMNKRVVGIVVGNRAMTEAVLKFAALNRIKPVTDRVFGFSEVREAYRYLATNKHVGKVLITVADS
ncbi:NAD(P)-dependent alcohol dehydrogenase [Permianibacter sp. IMCC34836]|uniref:zinc-dependent alcohol dehydrogenase family protein n=1 Tax=Permianibacter fluminis TaxID=2738515 RepID=UPI001552306D|nr:NAD(P)-dependent alcohol dehydrogenase [Permianibacter fluminis]NQD35932.1 NAD(P)-dependent alcohol dehydrogenase [Permianibacter fluminis]